MRGMFDTGRVVGTYPDGNSVDILMEDGSRLANVQVMVMTGSDQTGEIDLPDVGGPLDDTRWSHTAKFTRDVEAIVGFVRGVPFCFGFRLPQVNQISFSDKNRRIMRHASDVYTSIDDAGNFELFHPSGTYVRIGSSPAHEDLTGRDVDKKWAIARNTAAAPYLHIGVANAGASVSSLEFDPSGNVALKSNGNVTADVGGNLSATVAGTFDVEVAGSSKIKSQSVTIDSPQTTCTGALLVQGALQFQSGMTGQGGSDGGAAMTITGDAHVTGTVTADTDVLAAGVSGKGHRHPGVQSGGSETDPPTGG